jgi:hypothetical protein
MAVGEKIPGMVRPELILLRGKIRLRWAWYKCRRLYRVLHRRCLPLRRHADALWQSPWTAAALILSFVGVATCWWFFLPSPGKAVTALAVGAAIMNFSGELRGFGKFLWLCILFWLLLIENHAIDKERTDASKAQVAFLQNQHDSFKRVTDQATTNFATTTGALTSAIAGLGQIIGSTQEIAQQAEGILKTSQRVAATSQENLDEVTGKGSHPCVIPNTIAMRPDGAEIPFVIWNTGKNPLTGVDVFFDDFPQDVTGPVWGSQSLITVGTLPSGWPKPLPVIRPGNFGRDGTKHYTIEISTQNGYYNESLVIKRSIQKTPTDPPWAFEYWLIKPVTVNAPIKAYPQIKGRATLSVPMKDCWTAGWWDGSKD